MIQRIRAIIRKELIQLRRDRRTLAILIFTPLLQLFLFGYAVNMTITHIPTVVVDQSLDAQSRAYLEALVESQYFDLRAWAPDQAGAARALAAGQARVGIVIPPNFGTRIQQGTAQVLFLVDGSDMFTSQSAYNAANVIAQEHTLQLRLDRIGGTAASLPLTANTVVLYNPDMKDLWFMIPGLITMLLQQECVILTALGVVRERESGTLEQILVTPIRPLELMVGKALPNLIVAMINMLTILAIGVFWFRVPFRGDFWLFTGLSAIFSLAGLGLGLLISSVAGNMRQAQQLLLAVNMISLILAGSFFPRYAMPAAVQWLADLTPATFFIPIARAIINKGVGWGYFTLDAVALLAYVVVIVVVAARSFRQRLD